MTPITQTKFSNPEESVHGNCLAACVASLLEIPISEVPAFEDMADGKWFLALWDLIKSRGYTCHGTRHMRSRGDSDWPDDIGPGVDGHFIVGGASPRGFLRGHAVIYRDGAMVHDPHPEGTGLTKIWDIIMIEPAEAP